MMIATDVNGDGKVNYHGRTLSGGGRGGGVERAMCTIEEPLSDQEVNDMMVEADVLRGLQVVRVIVRASSLRMSATAMLADKPRPVIAVKERCLCRHLHMCAQCSHNSISLCSSGSFRNIKAGSCKL